MVGVLSPRALFVAQLSIKSRIVGLFDRHQTTLVNNRLAAAAHAQQQQRALVELWSPIEGGVYESTDVPLSFGVELPHGLIAGDCRVQESRRR